VGVSSPAAAAAAAALLAQLPGATVNVVDLMDAPLAVSIAAAAALAARGDSGGTEAGGLLRTNTRTAIGA
jgi:hypothetical protein